MSNTLTANPAIATTSISATTSTAPMSARDLASGSADQALGKPSAGYTQFCQVYEKDFAKWDAASNSKGYLTSQDVDKLIQDPKYKGEDAAALVALKKIESGALQSDGTAQTKFTAQQLKVTTTDHGHVGIDTDNVGADFQAAEKRINNSSSQMFAHGLPDGHAVSQGSVGDCFLDATLSGFANARPAELRKMIHDNGDGTSTVTFAGQPNNPVKVHNATDAEVALYTSSGKDGRWATTLEKAYGKLTHGADWNGSCEWIERLDGGGKATDAMGALTGFEGKYYGKVGASAEAMKEALAHHNLVVLSTNVGKDSERQANGLPTGHALTVEGYNAETNSFLVRNPWGTYGDRHDAYPSDGIARGKGLMEIPADKLDNDFRRVAIEQR